MRNLRIDYPPSTGNRELDAWLKRLVDQIQAMPSFSFFSGNPNTSGISGDPGTIGIDVSPSASSSSRIWAKFSSGTTNWGEVIY